MEARIEATGIPGLYNVFTEDWARYDLTTGQVSQLIASEHLVPYRGSHLPAQERDEYGHR